MVPPPPERLHNLPVQFSSFIGREQEIAEIKRLLETARLLTLTGSGGCGKTRLAFQVAVDSVEHYADGVWLVELAPLADPAFVAHTVAAAVGVPEQPNRPLTETLGNYLRTKKMLLLFDSCEHLHAACQRLIEQLLRASSTVHIVTTSREALGLEGELTYRVPSLRLPDVRHTLPVAELGKYDAIRLFVERAAIAQPGFTLTERIAPAVVQICQRLDGLPLAIEFAAARVRMLSVEQIAARLDDRFRLLTAARRQILPRQQTLRATMDWSYDLLSGPEQALLRRLSVFAGGWGFEAAEAVCAGDGVDASDILDLLTQLVDKSLVIAETHGGEARYQLLETVRQYGAEKLQSAGDAAEVRQRHRDWFVALAERAEPELLGPKQRMWRDRLETEHDNLRAAYEWTMAQVGGGREGLRLAVALFWFWGPHCHWSEGLEWLEEGLKCGDDLAPSIRAKALWEAARFAWRVGKDDRALALAEAGLTVSREAEDREQSVECLIAIANVAMQQGEHERAKQACAAALSLCSELENKYYASLTFSHLAEAMRYQGDYDQAIEVHEQSLALSKDAGNVGWTANVLRHLGHDHSRRGDHGHAAEYYKQSLRMWKEAGIRWVPVESLNGLGNIACVEQRYDRAARLFGAASQLSEVLGLRAFPVDQEYHDQHIATTRARLGEAAFAAAWTEGKAMTLEQAIEYALAPVEPGERLGRRRATRLEGDLLTAREREVAALVARGQTNREIATTLVISERTADAHVQNILNKLGFGSRAQIAGWAVERGLRGDSAAEPSSR